MPVRMFGADHGRMFSLCAVAACSLLAACGESGTGGEATKGENEMTLDATALPAPDAAVTGLTWAERQARFLEDWAGQPGVQTSPGGVLYRVIAEGEGASPAPGDLVRVHYEGRLIDDTVFDSSYARGEPAEFPSDRLIRGWQEILGMMQAGDTWEIAIPAPLAYGPNGAGAAIPPDSALLFKLELLDVKG